MEDKITSRPRNCYALAPVKCNSQILEALKMEAKKSDRVGKNIKAATIITKSLTVLDKLAREDQNPGVAHKMGHD